MNKIKWSPEKSDPGAEPSSGLLTKYTPKPIPITAIELPGVLKYEKWGGSQTGKKGDWLVEKENEVYTIDKKSFKETYTFDKELNRYVKTSPIWAIQVDGSGFIKTKEGESNYKKDDWIVYNSKDAKDGYTMTSKKLEAMYEVAK